MRHIRTKIQISRELILFIIFLIGGGYCLFYGLSVLQKEKNTIQLETLHKEDCTTGLFVAGSIDSYIGKNIINLGDGSYSGVSQTFLTWGKEYNFYTIPMDDDYYICVIISDEDTIEALENFSYGKGNDVYFEGEIIKSPVELNYEWYDGIEEFNGTGTNNIISEYVIAETNLKEKEKIIYLGILFLIISFIQFKFMGGFSGIISTENVIINPHRAGIAESYNMVNELSIAKDRLMLLNKRMLNMKKGCLYRIPLLVIGIYIICINYYWEIKIIGLVIAVISIKGIMKYILNSGNQCTEWLMRLFGTESLAMQIQNSKYIITMLENEIDKEKKSSFFEDVNFSVSLKEKDPSDLN